MARRSRWIPKLVAGGVALLASGMVGLGCPAKEERIQITVEGIAQLRGACGNTCAPAGEQPNEQQCLAKGKPCVFDPDEQACRRMDACRLAGHPPPNLRSDAQIRLVLVDPDRIKIRAKSACTPLFPCDQVDQQNQGKCLADGINQALDGAMPSGLTYDDLEDPSVVLPVLAIYQSPRGDGDAGASDGSPCAITNLIACAGLAAPVGGDGTYDLTCAACQDGPPGGFGVDNGPCPREMAGTKTTACFLEGCAKLLETLAP